MKNYEKYKNEIKNYKDDAFCNGFIKPHILEKDSCNGVGCIKCCMLQMMWLLEEYEEPKEPEVDWSKVEVDTPILVRTDEVTSWFRRYFAKYEDGKVYAWNGGGTSWTACGVSKWKYAKLAEGEEE